MVTGALWMIFTHADNRIPNLWRQSFVRSEFRGSSRTV
jgi:hypothetical protein